MTKEQLKAQRDERMDTAIALREPDRVPFAPKTSGFFMYGYDIPFYDAMIDARNMERGFRSYMRDYEPDAVNIGGLYGIPALEALGTDYLKWPGPTCGLPRDASFQHLDAIYLHDDEYDEYLQDPTHFTLTKLLPRKHKNLAGLSKLYLREVYDAGFFADLAVFNDPEVKNALFALMEAGKHCAERSKQMAEVRSWIADEGFSTYCQGTFFIPFDAFADSHRGIVRTVNDTLEFPDELEQTIRKITEMNVERIVKIYKSRGAKRILIPLHCGFDSFMSPASYERYYWPCLKNCIMTIIGNDMTPVVFCEGNYNTRLETISDVPKGKVVYMFENVDLQKAKNTVGKVATICGTVPNALLAFGTEDQVVKETRRQLDILAPGGGFIMDCSLMLDNAKHENMRAWHETTLKYGQY
jgi:hypothetical protein